MLLKIELLSDLPIWWLFFCIIFGIGLSFLLYFFRKQPFPSKVQKTLFVLRALIIAIISFLFLSPYIKQHKKQLENPIILFLQDNSASLMHTTDSIWQKNEYPKYVNTLLSDLEEKFQVQKYEFDSEIKDNLSFDYTGKQTNISYAIEELNKRYANRNIGALIVATDGIYNAGYNPENLNIEQYQYPIFTIALGDTNVRKDLVLKTLKYNKNVLLGNQFIVEAQVQASKCKDLQTRLEVKHENTTISTTPIKITADEYFTKIPISIQADKLGFNTYTISLQQVENEYNLLNNQKKIVVEVAPNKQKILIIGHAPHPDISAIKQAIVPISQYEVDITYFTDTRTKLSDYQIVIFHQLPNIDNRSLKLIEETQQKRIPHLFILGSQTSIQQFNKCKTGVELTNTKGSWNETQAVFNPKQNLFTIDEEISKILEKAPPLLTPYATYRLNNAVQVLAYQKIGNVTTDYPLITSNRNSDYRNICILGENIWRWRLYNYQEKQHHQSFNQLIQKLIQVLQASANQKPFRILYESNYSEIQPIEIKAELLNDNYEFIYNADILLELINSEGKKFPFHFSANEAGYSLNLGNLKEGIYSFVATASIGKTQYIDKGSFVVNAIELEQLQLLANHDLLHRLAKHANGKVFYANQLNALKDTIMQMPDIKPIAYYSKSFFPLLQIKLIFFLLLLLLAIEWIARKYFGGY